MMSIHDYATIVALKRGSRRRRRVSRQYHLR